MSGLDRELYCTSTAATPRISVETCSYELSPLRAAPLPAPEYAPGDLPPTKAERDTLLMRLWRQGKPEREIADALDLVPAAVGPYVRELRDAGKDLPYRRPPRSAVERAARHRRCCGNRPVAPNQPVQAARGIPELLVLSINQARFLVIEIREAEPIARDPLRTEYRFAQYRGPTEGDLMASELGPICTPTNVARGVHIPKGQLVSQSSRTERGSDR
jgi:hypothetical protein